MKPGIESGSGREDPLGRGNPGALMLFPGALGDAVCVQPVADRLARESGALTVYARGAAADVMALFPRPPAVRSMDAPEIARLFSKGDGPSVEWLRRFSPVISFTGARDPAVRGHFAAVDGARLCRFPDREGAVHATEAFWAAAFGPPAEAPEPRLVAPFRARAGATGALVIHPGSGGREKRAPAAVFARVAAGWAAAGGRAQIVLGPAEQGESAAWAEQGIDVVVPRDVTELAAVLQSSAAYLGNDSGPSHVAAALGRATVVLFVSTSPRSFGPRGPRVAYVETGADESSAAVADAALAALGRAIP